MKIITTIILILGVINLTSQSIERQVIGATGGTAISGTVIVTATTGEAVVKTFTSGVMTLTQGYQQTNDNNTVEIKEIVVTANYKLYPNPTTNKIKLEITTTNLDAAIQVNLYSNGGKLICSKNKNLVSGIKSSLSFNLKNEAAGIYFIKILDAKGKLSKTLKIIKE